MKRFSVFVHNSKEMNGMRQAVTNHYAGCQTQFSIAEWSCHLVTKVRGMNCLECAAGASHVPAYV